MKKIMFNDHYGLTQAVLNGEKTMTRRVIPPKVVKYALNVYRQDYFKASLDYLNDKEALEGWLLSEKKSRYVRGEVVAIAQCYKNIIDELPDRYREWVLAYYSGTKAWTNKLYILADLMPNQIKITDVKIERMQDITDEDCLKEGVICETFDDGTPLCYKVAGLYDNPKSLLLKSYATPRTAFIALIDCLNGGHKGLWESNPWVVVYEFVLK